MEAHPPPPRHHGVRHQRLRGRGSRRGRDRGARRARRDGRAPQGALLRGDRRGPVRGGRRRDRGARRHVRVRVRPGRAPLGRVHRPEHHHHGDGRARGGRVHAVGVGVQLRRRARSPRRQLHPGDGRDPRGRSSCIRTAPACSTTWRATRPSRATTTRPSRTSPPPCSWIPGTRSGRRPTAISTPSATAPTSPSSRRPARRRPGRRPSRRPP